MITHILLIHIGSQVKTTQSQSYILKKFAKNFNFIILQKALDINMKWIQLVLWKMQSGHNAVHRRTDMKPVYPPSNLAEAGVIIIL